ncbi:MAG: patatin-like phospholipase family protein [Nocardioidaceae bacterium]|nr:patatin-like phospholipase family protein [Nocardioidaceae bacterium]
MSTRQRALVLGGGGITGIAWELGVLAGLKERGVDLTAADIVIGTSAGSVVGAQITSSTDLEVLYDGQLADPSGEVGARLGLAVGLRYLIYLMLPGSSQDKRRRLGRAALRTTTVPVSERVEIIRERLVRAEWPASKLLVTAVEAETGRFEVFDRNSGVGLVDAVASSCAVPLVWPPVPVNGRSYVDGGVRSATNADLATGADVVVVLAPLSQSLSKSTRVDTQLARLGTQVQSVVVRPDARALKAIGRNVLDPARRADAARAGREQASDVAAEVSAAWRSADED